MALAYLQPGSASWPPISDAPERVGQSDDVLAKDNFDTVACDTRQAQLQQLAVDPRRTPERIGAADPPNQISELRPDRGPTASASTLLRASAHRDQPDRSHRDHQDRSIVIKKIGIVITGIGAS